MAGLFASGAVAGAAWLFVHGDETWPAMTGVVLTAVFVLVFVVVEVAAVVLGYCYGKRRETVSDTVPVRHAMLAIVAAVIPVLVFVLHQFSVGNFGRAPESVRCLDYCSVRGHVGAEISPADDGPRLCSCLDAQGARQESLPVDALPVDATE